MNKEKEISRFTEKQLTRLLKEAGLADKDINELIENYLRYIEKEPSRLNDLLSSKGKLYEDDVSKIIVKMRKEQKEIGSSVLDCFLYIKYKRAISEIYERTTNWDEVIAVVFDDQPSQEAFIDYIEETYNTKVSDVKCLLKLTKIKAEDENFTSLEEIIRNSRYSKYCRALKIALQKGAKYKDLLKIKPQDYGLSKTWNGCLSSDQYSSILWTLSKVCSVDTIEFIISPDLRSVAREIEAPYSVVMDCFNLTRSFI
jgi:hypothetical protein